MDIFEIANPDSERTEAEKEAANQRAERVRLEALGRAVDEGKPLDKARALAEETSVKEKSNIYNWYIVNPNQLYPEMVKFIRTQLVAGVQGDGIIRSEYYPAAQALPEEAWEMALITRQEFTELAEIEVRMRALEICRLWFTELLHRALRWQAIGANEKFWHTEPPAEAAVPLGLHIEKDEAWRL